MPFKINRKIIYEFLYIAGIILGTIIVNSIGKYDFNGLKFICRGSGKSTNYILETITRRSMQIGIFYFLCMTPYKNVFTASLLIYSGILSGVLTSLMTIKHGYAGPILYIISIFPHMAFYVVSFIMIIQLQKKSAGRLGIKKIMTITALSTAGIFSELFISPYLTGFFWRY